MVNIQNENGMVVLSVEDTGIGIAPEHQERIFERLSIVKHAAKIHNAKVDVKSHVGKGTTVIVTFPK